MNTTRSTKRLVNTVNNEHTMEYEDETEVQDGDEIIVFGKRYDKSNIRWKVERVLSEFSSFEEDPGRQQLVLKGTISVEEGRYSPDYTFNDVTVEKKSPIDKCKDDIKEKLIQLWQIGWPNKYLYGDCVVDIDEGSYIGKNLSSPTVDDFKITTVRANGKAMHLGTGGLMNDYEFKLGVKWALWHDMSPTDKFHTLTHELTHCIHHHHRKIFFIEHAKFIQAFEDSEARKERAEAIIGGEIDWNKVKALAMKGVHRQPKDIDTLGYECRREACVSVVDELSEIFDYSYEVATPLHLHPPTSSFLAKWFYEYTHDDSDEPYPSTQELTSNKIEKVPVSDVEYDEEYTDEELYDFMYSLNVEQPSGLHKFIYSEDELPVVDEDGNLVEGSMLLALYKQFQHVHERENYVLPMKVE